MHLYKRYSLYWKAIGMYAEEENDEYLKALMEAIQEEMDEIIKRKEIQ